MDCSPGKKSPAFERGLSLIVVIVRARVGAHGSVRATLHFLSPSGEGRLVGLVQLVRNSPYGRP